MKNEITDKKRNYSIIYWHCNDKVLFSILFLQNEEENDDYEVHSVDYYSALGCDWAKIRIINNIIIDAYSSGHYQEECKTKAREHGFVFDENSE